MANYPTSLPSSTPADHAEVLGEVIAIATELGLDPSGTGYSSVKDRLTGLSAAAVLAAGAGTTYYGIPGMYYIGTNGNEVVAGGRIYYEPFQVTGATITVTELATHVKTAATAGASARMGIYNADTAWQPTTLVLDAGAVAIDSVGIKSITALSQPLPPGRYVKAITKSANVGLAYLQCGPLIVATTDFQATITRLRVTSAYAALASTGVAWDSVDSTGGGGVRHTVFMRWT